MLEITPLRAALGATVQGLDADDLTDEITADLRKALIDHKVLFFPGQHLTTEQQIAVGSLFGRLEATTDSGADKRQMAVVDGHPEVLRLDSIDHPMPANMWHTDVTFAEEPPLGALLSMQISAASGGDTLWSNTERAYDELSPPIKRALEGLTATHGRPGLTDEATHPVVKVHPESGRPVLFVNRGWTARVDGLSQIESSRLLTLLCDHMERPEYTVRWSWTAGDAALWDNRCTMHYALWDYGTEHRRIHRVTIYAA